MNATLSAINGTKCVFSSCVRQEDVRNSQLRERWQIMLARQEAATAVYQRGRKLRHNLERQERVLDRHLGVRLALIPLSKEENVPALIAAMSELQVPGSGGIGINNGNFAASANQPGGIAPGSSGQTGIDFDTNAMGHIAPGNHAQRPAGTAAQIVDRVSRLQFKQFDVPRDDGVTKRRRAVSVAVQTGVDGPEFSDSFDAKASVAEQVVCRFK